MRKLIAPGLVVLAVACLVALAPDAAREETALAFVRENHPELAELLEQLKAMKPERYQRAIAELALTSRSLANLKKGDGRRYQAALDVWKARSRAELLAAELLGTAGGDRDGRLRAAVENQIAAEIRQNRLEREFLAERLRKLDATIERMETQHDELIESRTQNLLKKGQRARRQQVSQPASPRPAQATVKGKD